MFLLRGPLTCRSLMKEHTPYPIVTSSYLNSGDYTPTRLEAQADAVNLIFGAKTQSNPENTVSLMTMAGKRYKFLFLSISLAYCLQTAAFDL